MMDVESGVVHAFLDLHLAQFLLCGLAVDQYLLGVVGEEVEAFVEVVILHIFADRELPIEPDLRPLHPLHIVELGQFQILVVEPRALLVHLADHVVPVVGVVAHQFVLGLAEHDSLGFVEELLWEVLWLAQARQRQAQAWLF